MHDVEIVQLQVVSERPMKWTPGTCQTVRAIAKWDAAQIKRDRKRVSRGF
jgi:hypothetical protein